MDQTLGNRRQRRFPAKDLTLFINGKTYRIFNINEYGVGFLIDAPEEIQLGSEITPTIVGRGISVQVEGIPRHISHYASKESHLIFKTGWVCGTEFSTRHDRDGSRLFEKYIAENIARADDLNDTD